MPREGSREAPRGGGPGGRGAAGETPSPALVAASGDDGTLPRAKAWAWFAGAAVSLALAAWSLVSVLFINHAPMPLDTGALERRAREITVSLGYVAPPQDWASEWAGGASPTQRLRFNYRQSPGELFPTIGLSPVALPFRYPEDIVLQMDARGRLQNLDIGGTTDYSDTTGARPVDWTPLLVAIGPDAPPVPSASRRWPSAYLSDTRAAWTAVIDGVPSDIEAAALRGRAVSLRIRKVGAPDEHPAPSSKPLPWQAYVVILTVLFVPVVLGVLARRNMRLGRGDRRGATRLAVFTFVVFALSNLSDRHWALSLGGVFGGSVLSMLFPLFFAVAMWLSYIAVEPFLRRRWPYLLVSWARLLDGRIRDGIVGQAVLAGVVVGTVLTSLQAGKNVLDRAATLSGYFYNSNWWHGAYAFNVFGTAVAGGAIMVGILVIARMVFRRDWAAWGALALFSAVINMNDLARSPLWLVLLFAGVATVLTLGVLRRFGLLALVVALAVQNVLTGAPLTLDPARWYFWRGVLATGIVLALAILGFMNVLGKQSLLPVDAMDE